MGHSKFSLVLTYFLAFALPSYLFSRIIPFLFQSQIAQSTLREDFQMAFILHFPSLNWRTCQIRNPGRFPAKPRDNANPPPMGADAQPLPLPRRIDILWLNAWIHQNRKDRFERWRGQQMCEHRFGLRVL